jgi:hypothetical protein
LKKEWKHFTIYGRKMVNLKMPGFILCDRQLLK